MDKKLCRCAVYTRKSTEDGLEQEFNSLDAQYEACAAYALSQRHEGWILNPERYDDGGFSGGNLQRPGLTRLLADVAAGKADIILLYKIDRLTRLLSDFAKNRRGAGTRPEPAFVRHHPKFQHPPPSRGRADPEKWWLHFPPIPRAEVHRPNRIPQTKIGAAPSPRGKLEWGAPSAPLPFLRVKDPPTGWVQ